MATLTAGGSQILQQLFNAGVDEQLEFAHGGVAAAVDGDGLLCHFLGAAEAHERVTQRGADEGAHFLGGGDGQVKVAQTQLGALEDALAGIHQRAVQIEKDGSVGHKNAPLDVVRDGGMRE